MYKINQVKVCFEPITIPYPTGDYEYRGSKYAPYKVDILNVVTIPADIKSTCILSVNSNCDAILVAEHMLIDRYLEDIKSKYNVELSRSSVKGYQTMVKEIFESTAEVR